MATCCKSCEEPLVISIEPEDESEELQQESEIPDDLELPCRCHFHWQCLMDLASEVGISLQCPSCHGTLVINAAGPSTTNPVLRSSSAMSIPTRYTNEGGIQEEYDVLPFITEEAYLATQPQARPARAFHLLCSEGDVEGTLELLRDVNENGYMESEDDGPSWGPNQIIRYQDPLANERSGLHIAIDKGHEGIVWLLLWMASTLPTEIFPETVVAQAQAVALQRNQIAATDDIRVLRDGQGCTAEDLAKLMDGKWMNLVEAGALRPAV